MTSAVCTATAVVCASSSSPPSSSSSSSSSSSYSSSVFLKLRSPDVNLRNRRAFRRQRMCSGGAGAVPAFSSLSCLAVSETLVSVSELPSGKLQRLIEEFRSLTEPIDRVKKLLEYAALLPPLPESDHVPSNRVMGCTAQVWLSARMDCSGRMWFAADSDSEITKGFCSCLLWIMNGALPEELTSVTTDDLVDLNVGLPGRAHSRVNTWHNVLISMQKKTKALVSERDGKHSLDPFPSLLVTRDAITAKGSYAEAQAKFLSPDPSKVTELVSLLKEKRIGVVAHFYMDPEVQGVLTATQKDWLHVNISDSLVMADSAVKMAEAGCRYITVLGVDFMSENVRAILDQAGFPEVGVYRMSNERIGCSLADAAAGPAYMFFLKSAARSPRALHVIYINTSLEIKAFANELVPTITCTSSNVVQIILQAFAQVPELDIWYGPDSYMGANITKLFQQMANMTDEEIKQIHPEHDKTSISSLLSRLHYYQDGACIVHDLFGHEVVKKIHELYCDAYLTAHFEVPGEMFTLSMEANRRGMGVVGSTKNILDFIKQQLQEALDRGVDEHLRFVLGTESGMVTSIVAAVRNLLGSSDGELTRKPSVDVEIVFPVSSESISRISSSDGPAKWTSHNDPAIVPGVSAGEGCSINGGCASCPYMKMNTLDSLLKVCHQLPDRELDLTAFKASRFMMRTPFGHQVAEIGCEPILHMRHFQKYKKLPEKLVHHILHHCNGRAK